MNRQVKWFLWIAVAAAALMPMGALIWRTQHLPPSVTPREWVFWAVLAFIPAWGAFGVWRFTRAMNARVPGTAEDNGRHFQAWTVFGYIILLLIEAWMVLLYVRIIPTGPDLAERNLIFLRGVILAFGVAIVIRGNFLGKLSPPVFKDKASPDAALWRRYARRSGLVWVTMGALSAISAIWLPISLLRWVWVATAAMLLAMGFISHRGTKSGWWNWV